VCHNMHIGIESILPLTYVHAMVMVSFLLYTQVGLYSTLFSSNCETFVEVEETGISYDTLLYLYAYCTNYVTVKMAHTDSDAPVSDQGCHISN
jgi:hypothetical protein